MRLARRDAVAVLLVALLCGLATALPPFGLVHGLSIDVLTALRWQMFGARRDAASAPDEIWNNDVYTVTVRRHEADPVFDTRGGVIQLGISALDGTARHDWREFQAIKNQLAGPECEAFELYPAESRLLDPSNYYTLWCFPGLRHIRVGKKEGRRVWGQDQAMAPQRELPAQ